jgi:type IV pilus assembly protein PilC
MFDQGASFKQALLTEEVIPRTARELIEASPTSQALHKNLESAAVLVQESQSVKKKLLMNLIQPGFMFALCLVLLFVSAAYIIPGFIKIFGDLGAETPQVTLVILQVADVVKWVMGGIIGALLLFLAYWFTLGRNSERFRSIMDTIAIKTPGIGPILQLSATSRLFQLLAANLSTGINEPDALRGAANGCGNDALKSFCLLHADKMMNDGVPLKEFVNTKLVPDDARQILSSAPSIRQEIEIMTELGPEYRKEANLQLETLSRTLEPTVNYMVYGVAGVLIVSIMLPMYSIYPALMKMGG